MTLRQAIASQVRGLFAQPDGRPSITAAPPDQRWLPAGSVAFDVHADVTAMMAGGVAALLMQMLHPAALAGVWDHSDFRRDMSGRLRRTAAFIAATTYASRADADAAIARVRRIHARVAGILPDGQGYQADDPRLLAFVGVTEALAFLKAHLVYRDPLLSAARQDRYIAEMGRIAEALGAGPMPATRRSAETWLAAARPTLRVDARTAEVRSLLLSARAARPGMAPFQRLAVEAGIDLLPGWARAMHGLERPLPARPLVRATTGGTGVLLRWAFARTR